METNITILIWIVSGIISYLMLRIDNFLFFVACLVGGPSALGASIGIVLIEFIDHLKNKKK
jgi:hypothetical protein